MQKWLEVIMTADKSFLNHLTELLISQRIKTWVEEEEQNLVRLKIYIPYFEDVENYLRSLKTLLDVQRVQVVTCEINDEDWATSWQRFFEVIRIGNRIVIKPPWKDYEAQKDDIIIEIEPRSAFGTGYHPTTSGTLILMEKYFRPYMKILDMGCGSGILSIAAGHLGASSITGIDFDEICIREASENYSLAREKYPHITSNANFKFSDGFSSVDGIYDMIVINIDSQFILSNIDGIISNIAPDGLFISGSVASERVEEISTLFDLRGLKLVEKIEWEGWVGVVFKS